VGRPPAWRLGEVPTTPHHVMKREHLPRTWTDPSVQAERWKGDVECGTWNVRILYRSGSSDSVVPTGSRG